jgi:hypothetical protein
VLYTWLYMNAPDGLKRHVPRPKVLSAIIVAVFTWVALAIAEALGVDLRAQVPLIGQLLAGKVLTWSQAINTLAPLVAAYLTREARNVQYEGVPPEEDIDVTQGESGVKGGIDPWERGEPAP